MKLRTNTLVSPCLIIVLSSLILYGSVKSFANTILHMILSFRFYLACLQINFTFISLCNQKQHFSLSYDYSVCTNLKKQIYNSLMPVQATSLKCI